MKEDLEFSDSKEEALYWRQLAEEYAQKLVSLFVMIFQSNTYVCGLGPIYLIHHSAVSITLGNQKFKVSHSDAGRQGMILIKGDSFICPDRFINSKAVV